ncbi:type III-A CRISPR-associated RAMP protein Csm3 [Azotobacter armeniacus]
MQLNDIRTLQGSLELVSGLHIGAGNQEMHIGGLDNPVIKHPYTQEPYIPGSSLKGRMRSLLEWRAGVVGECQGKPVSARALRELQGAKLAAAGQIACLFGLSGDADDGTTARLGPTRLSFWDCALARDWLSERQPGELLTETKSENLIDRIRGVAEHPRQTERVPAGARFDFRLTVKQLDGDSAELLDVVLAGLKLLELDGIGGSSSRGYGKIRFAGLHLDGEDIQTRFDATQPFA